MKAHIKILCGAFVLVIGLLVPAIDGWAMERPLQLLNLIPLTVIELILLWASAPAFFGAATVYLLWITIAYTVESTATYHGSFVLIGTFVVHLVYGLPAVFVGAMSGHLIAAWRRRRNRADSARGFEPVMSTRPKPTDSPAQAE